MHKNQQEYNKRWVEKNKEYKRYHSYKSTAKTFIKKHAAEEDLQELIDLIGKHSPPTLNWYEFIHRGLSPGCQPKGFIQHDENKGRFGWIAYDRKLTDKEMSSCELREVR